MTELQKCKLERLQPELVNQFNTSDPSSLQKIQPTLNTSADLCNSPWNLPDLGHLGTILQSLAALSDVLPTNTLWISEGVNSKTSVGITGSRMEFVSAHKCSEYSLKTKYIILWQSY